MADGGKSPPVTRREVLNKGRNMAGKQLKDMQLQLPPPRAVPPPSSASIASTSTLATPHSSSLPSTPYAHARTLSDEYRTPPPANRPFEAAAKPRSRAPETTTPRSAFDPSASPAGRELSTPQSNLDLSTPRSARSESDGNVRPTARAPASHGCKFETGMAFSRRRIPYSFGGDILEPVAKVKKQLEPAEEQKLSADMQELYDRLLPSADGEERRAKFVQKLEKILNSRWPGHDIKAHVFGSSGNLLFSNDSDVDICITTSLKSLERVCNLAKALADHGMERVVCVPSAKVPIVKIWDPELKLACDMNVNNTLAMVNTRMIRIYVQIDPRVRPLAMVIKHWTRRRVLNDAALGGTLSSYTWICMIINFLQTRSPPILPNLQGQSRQQNCNAEGHAPAFADDLETFKGFGEANTETLGELLFHFFRRYGHEIDFEKHVVSVRSGTLIPKQAKKWHLMQNNRLCVEEPFTTDRNLGNTTDDISFRGVHMELRRAFDHVSHAKLEECCKEFVFPPQEEKVWTRPAQQPRPVLTRSLSQQGRGPRTNGGGSNNRQNNKNRTGGSNRRASSAVAMNKLPPFAMGPASASLPLSNDRLSGSQIHAQLIHHYQLLQAQEQQLRMQMQERAHQAQLSAHAASTLQPIQMPPASAMPQQTTFGDIRPHPNIEPGPLSAPLRGVQGTYYPVHLTSQLPAQRFPMQVTPSQSATNPPSPTMSLAALGNQGDLARGTPRSHRGLTTNEDNATVRSHSQPPGNGVRNNIRTPRHAGQFFPNNVPQGQALGANTLMQFQQMYMQAKMSAKAPQRPPVHSPDADSPGLRPFHMDQMDGGSASRYYGYFFDPNMPYPLPGHGMENGLAVPPHPGDGLPGRPRRASVSPNVNRVRSQTPRSGSPLNSPPLNDPASNYFSTLSPHQTSHPANAAPGPETESSNNQTPQPRSGPVILDGSNEDHSPPPYDVPKHYQYSMRSAPGPRPGDVSMDRGMSLSSSPRRSPSGSMETSAPRTPPLQHSTVLQFGDFPARATLRNSRVRGTVGTHEQPTAELNATSSPKANISEKLPPTTGLGIDIGGDPQDLPPSKPETPQKPTAKKVADSISTGNVDTEATLQPAFLSPVREVRTPSPIVTRKNLPRSISKSQDLGRPRRLGETTGSPVNKAVAPKNATPAATESKASGTGDAKPSYSNNDTKSGNPRSSSPVKNGPPREKNGSIKSAAVPSQYGQGPSSQNTTRQAQSTKSTAGQRPQSAGSNHIAAQSALAPGPVPTPLQTGGWQQSVSKRTRKYNRKSSSTNIAPLVSEIERKGG